MEQTRFSRKSETESCQLYNLSGENNSKEMQRRFRLLKHSFVLSSSSKVEIVELELWFKLRGEKKVILLCFYFICLQQA